MSVANLQSPVSYRGGFPLVSLNNFDFGMKPKSSASARSVVSLSTSFDEVKSNKDSVLSLLAGRRAQRRIREKREGEAERLRERRERMAQYGVNRQNQQNKPSSPVSYNNRPETPYEENKEYSHLDGDPTPTATYRAPDATDISDEDRDFETVKWNVGIGKGFHSNQYVLQNFSVHRKYYSKYLMKRVFVSLDNRTVDPAILWGFGYKGKKENDHKFITSSSEAFELLYLILPTRRNKDEATAIISLKDEDSGKWLAELTRSFVFMGVPSEILRAEKIPVYTSGVFEGMPLRTLKNVQYEEILKKYPDIIIAYDDWQTSEIAPLSAQGVKKISGYLQNQKDFSGFLHSYEDKEVLNSYESVVAVGKVGKEPVAATPGAATETTDPATSPSAPATPSSEEAKSFQDSVTFYTHDTPEMQTLTGYVSGSENQKDIALSVDGNTRTYIVRKSNKVISAVGKMIQGLQVDSGFIMLADDKDEIDFENKNGELVRYIEACNKKGSILVSMCVSFTSSLEGGNTPNLALISVNRISSREERAELAELYEHYKASQEKKLGVEPQKKTRKPRGKVAAPVEPVAETSPPAAIDEPPVDLGSGLDGALDGALDGDLDGLDEPPADETPPEPPAEPKVERKSGPPRARKPATPKQEEPAVEPKPQPQPQAQTKPKAGGRGRGVNVFGTKKMF